jgi:SAM-dependent methyltransferase
MVEPHIPAFAQYTSWAGASVLEIGCGIGTDTICFARAGAQVTAVDLSPVSLKIAHGRAIHEAHLYDVHFYEADAEHLSRVVPVEPYDLIYSFGVLHHTPHPEAALRELLQYTRPGTIFKLMLYHRHSTKAWWALRKTRGDRHRLTKAERIAAYSEAQTGCPVTWTYTKSQARNLMLGLGLDIIDLHVDHIFPYSIPEYIEHRYVRAAPWKYMPGWLFRALERVCGWHILITAQYP